MAKNEKDQSQAVKIALIEQEVENLKEWKSKEEKRSSRIYYAVFMTAITAVGFVLSKAWEQLWK